MSGQAPHEAFVVYETRYCQVNQRVDATLPGYLMVGATEPKASELEDLSPGALMELGGVLGIVTAFFDKQGAVHARVSVDFAREFGCLLEAAIPRAP